MSRFGNAKLSSGTFIVVEAYWVKDKPYLEFRAINPNTAQSRTFRVDDRRQVEFGDIVEDFHTSSQPCVRIIAANGRKAAWVDLVSWQLA